MDTIKIIGITGIIGSGKSTVANLIREMDYPVLSSDENAKLLMVENQQLVSDIIDLFGENAYNEDKTLNKKFLSDNVFSSEKNSNANLEKLNRLVHPAVIEYNLEQIEKLVDNGEDLIFVESALIFELGMEEGYDYVINVDVPIEQAVQRTIKRTGLSRDNIINRMNIQLHANEKKKFADFTIDNSKGIDDLKIATDFILSLIKDLPSKDFISNKLDDETTN